MMPNKPHKAPTTSTKVEMKDRRHSGPKAGHVRLLQAGVHGLCPPSQSACGLFTQQAGRQAKGFVEPRATPEFEEQQKDAATTHAATEVEVTEKSYEGHCFLLGRSVLQTTAHWHYRGDRSQSRQLHRTRELPQPGGV